MTYNVTTISDENDVGACFPGDPDCSLREAVNAANTVPSDDVVMLPIGTYLLSRAGVDETGVNGDLDVLANGKLTIQGAGARDARIHANRIDRVLDVHQSANLDLSGVTVTGGDKPPLPAPQVLFLGGGIRIDGAGASPDAIVTITDSTIAFNHADRGAGISASNDSNLTLVNSTVGANVVEQSGGGIQNVAGCGGCTAALSLTNSTVSSNSQTASQDATPLLFGGGGIANTGSVVLRHATVASNTAKVHGGGIQRLGGTIDAKDTIVSENKAASATEANCDLPITSSGFNLERGTTCGFTQSSDLNGDPNLASLTDNGGPTDTQFPGIASKAVDTGDSGDCPPTDQRGVGRPKAGGCDRGAVEAEATDLSISMTDSPDPVQNGDIILYRITVTNEGLEPARGVLVTDHLPSSLGPGSSSPGNACSNTQNEVCRIGTLLPGSSEIIVIHAHTKAAGTVSNTVTAWSTSVDTNLSNNQVTRTTTVTLRAGPCANLKVGTAGADTLNGTSKGDVLRGLGGPDTLYGLGGADCLEGGTGNDQLYGGSANDKLSGGDGGDFVRGGSGKDTLNGGKNNDTISAADGERDTIDCGQGSNDKALVDSHDSVKNCESVTLSG